MAQQCEVIDMMYVLLSITPKAFRLLIALHCLLHMREAQCACVIASVEERTPLLWLANLHPWILPLHTLLAGLLWAD